MVVRRSHTKSRKGCRECKRRKVKCDELHPSCFNCTRHGVSCSFAPADPPTTEAQSSSHPSPAGETVPAASKPGATSRDDFLHLDIASGRLRIVPSSFLSFNADSCREMELMHHYSVHTSNTLALREDIRHVWRVVVPQEGYQNLFVMHGILAVSALHKAMLVPSERQTYLTVSAYYQGLGLEGFAPRLQSIDKDNWQPVFCFATTVVLYVCLLPARSENQTLTDPLGSILELFTFVRGMQSFLGPFFGKLRDSNYSPLVHGVWIDHVNDEEDRLSDPPLSHTCLPADTFQALRLLKATFQADLQPSVCQDYMKGVNELHKSARFMARAGMHIETGMVMLWPYLIPERILTDLQLRNPYALVLLAYFCTLLSIMGTRYWFLRGWGRRLLAEIDTQLARHGELMPLMKWPKDVAASIYLED